MNAGIPTSRAPLRKERDDHLAPAVLVNSARKVTPVESGVTLVLVLAGGAPISFFASYLNRQPYNQQQFALLILLGILCFCVIETFAIILLWGFERLVLPRSFMHWLGVATIGEIGGLLTLAVKFVFFTH